MKRMERVCAMLIHLQTKKWVTADELASRFGICVRTVYRDIRTLEATGVPLYSEAGKGYSLVDGYHLPPVMFTPEETAALITAGKMIDGCGDTAFTRQFDNAIYKIKAVLSHADQEQIIRLERHMEAFRPDDALPPLPEGILPTLQTAILQKKAVIIRYVSQKEGTPEARKIKPLMLGYNHRNWYVLAFCDLRKAYRIFRLDRVAHIQPTEEPFQNRTDTPSAQLLQAMYNTKPLTPVTLLVVKGPVCEALKRRYAIALHAVEAMDGHEKLLIAVDAPALFCQQLLQYEPVIEILDPPALKDEVRRQAAALEARMQRLISENTEAILIS